MLDNRFAALLDDREDWIVAASFLALALPAVHPIFRPSVGVGSHLLWIVHVLPAAVLTYRYGREGALGVLVLSPALVVGGERLFGAGYGMAASWQTALSLAASVGFANLLVAGFATSARRTRQELAHSAEHDALTGLLNRRGLQARLRERLASADNERDGRFAVVYLDLDRFARVNDSLGHPIGDSVLQTVADRIVAAVRPDDLMARIGGDEFLVVLCSASDDEQAVEAARRILDAVREEPIHVEDHSVVLTASAGVAPWRESYGRPEEVVRDADAALSEAKRRDPGTAVLFRQEMHDRIRQQLRTENQLRDAHQSGQLELHYQPLVRAADGRIRGGEALLRWRHPERGIVSPGAFLPVLENSDLLGPVGCWTLGELRRQGRKWAARFHGDAPFVLSVNVTARQLTQSSFVEEAVRTARDLEGAGARLEIELTEAALMRDVTATRNALDRLRDAGALFAVDDFGTGFSSLRYLHELPVDTLKIDRVFVCSPDDGSCRPAIPRTVVGLAESLGLETVAEGVEGEAHRREMERVGVDLLQGYWFGKPLPASGFEVRHLPAERFAAAERLA